MTIGVGRIRTNICLKLSTFLYFKAVRFSQSRSFGKLRPSNSGRVCNLALSSNRDEDKEVDFVGDLGLYNVMD